MKQLPIQTPAFRQLLNSFSQWLELLNYAPVTIESWPVHVREFLHFLESHQITNLQQLQPHHSEQFHQHILHRKNKRNSGGLSSASIHKISVAVNVFGHYLRSATQAPVELKPLKIKESGGSLRYILTPVDIKELYQATYHGYHFNSTAFGQRDRAMLAVFYGCGLRKTEGTLLNVDDVDLSGRLLTVHHGKGRKERQVPISSTVANDLEYWLFEGRSWFLENHSQFHVRGVLKQEVDANALFLSIRGNRMVYGWYACLAILQKRAGLEHKIGLHDLRHAIATHLLAAGMDLEKIQQFLGHSTLESTQIYTHILNEKAHEVVS